jgi:hypothetical protein
VCNIAASGAAATSHGTSIVRNQSHGDSNGEAQTGRASKKYGTGIAPNVPLNSSSVPNPMRYAGAQ